MKPLPLLVCAAIVLCGVAARAAYDIPKDSRGLWDYAAFNFTAKKGDWNQTGGWEKKNAPVPPLPRVNVMAGATLTINRPVDFPIALMNVGYGKTAGPTHVIIAEGAKLQAGSVWMPNGIVPESKADLVMRGGELTVGGIKDHSGHILVGGGTTASGTARFDISGGKLAALAGLRVGSTTPNTNVGTFSVQGSLPDISVAGEGAWPFRVNAASTLEFVLDGKGVATIKADKVPLSFAEGALVRVDGKAYKGGAKNIVLAQASAIAASISPRIEIVGFDSAYKPGVTIEKNRLMLKIAR